MADLRIYKYPLTMGRVSMPIGAKILCAQAQYGVPTLWALVDITAESKIREFTVLATGDQVPEGFGIYIGTTQSLEGALVLHIFEKGTDHA